MYFVSNYLMITYFRSVILNLFYSTSASLVYFQKTQFLPPPIDVNFKKLLTLFLFLFYWIKTNKVDDLIFFYLILIGSSVNRHINNVLSV